MPAMNLLRAALVPFAVSMLVACSDDQTTTSTTSQATTTAPAEGECPQGVDIPTPTVRSGATSVEATAGAIYLCDPENGPLVADGPLVFGDDPVLLAAADDIVVEVAGEVEVSMRWDGDAFVDQGDGTFVAPLPADGCYRLGIDISDPTSDNVGDFAVTVVVGDTTC